MKIFPNGSRASESGDSRYFTGDVTLTPLISAPDPARLRGVSVTFAAGARTFWHTHPLGQTLIVTAGSGLAQTENGQIQVLSPGDVVWFAPGERHWHGASPTQSMTHIALQEAQGDNAVTWQEPVSDSDYNPA